MSFIKIWIHLVWSTKYRDPIITRELKPKLLQHIKKNAGEKGYFIDELNCTSDHIHVLVALGPEQNISNIARLTKGESSHWVNSKRLTTCKFKVSVSPHDVAKVKEYIRNQEKHHRIKIINRN